MIHNKFLNALPNLVGGSTQRIPTHLTFSSDDVSVQFTDNSISGETGSRISLDTPSIDNNSITFVADRPSTLPPSGGTRLNASALFTSSSDGDMWATALISSVLHTTSFNIEVRHTFNFVREL